MVAEFSDIWDFSDLIQENLKGFAIYSEIMKHDVFSFVFFFGSKLLWLLGVFYASTQILGFFFYFCKKIRIFISATMSLKIMLDSMANLTILILTIHGYLFICVCLNFLSVFYNFLVSLSPPFWCYHKWDCFKNRHIDQRNRTEPRKKPIHTQPIFDKGGKYIPWGKDSLFNK